MDKMRLKEIFAEVLENCQFEFFEFPSEFERVNLGPKHLLALAQKIYDEGFGDGQSSCHY